MTRERCSPSSRPRTPFVLWLAMLVAVGPSWAQAQAVTITPEASLRAGGEVSALGFSSDGRLLLVGDREGNLSIDDLLAGSRTLELRPGDRPIVYGAFVTGDTAVVTVDDRGGVLLHAVPSVARPEGAPPEPLARLATAAPPTRITLDPGRRYLAVATRNDRIEIFDLPTRQRIGEIDARGDLDDLLHLGFDRLGRQLLAVTRKGRVTAWNPATLQSLRRITLQSDALHGSRTVVHAVGQDRSANVLVVALEEVALPRGGLRGPARPTDLVREDHLLVFDWHGGAQIRGMRVPDGVVEALAVGPGNDHVVVGHGERITVVDLRSGEGGAAATAPADVSRIAVAPGDDRLAVGSADGAIGLWRMAYREPVAADEIDEVVPGLSGRIRVLGSDAPALPADRSAVLAVLPFDDRQGDEQMASMVAEFLITQLANVDHLTLVERLRIDEILQEQELQRRGLTEANGLELGRILNADYILLGSVGAFGTSHTLSARVLDVRTGEAVSGRQVLCEECRGQDFFDVVHLLGTTIAR